MKSPPLYVVLISAFCLTAGFSCKKFIEKQKEKAAQNVITSGTWYVARYQAGDSDLTAGFTGYSFKFMENGTVDGVSGTEKKSGIWSVDISALTILAAFPADQLPVNQLNHNWKIVDSYNDSVSANTQGDSRLIRLELHKNL